MLKRWLLAHPRSVGETYFSHQRMAFAFAGRLFAAGAACFVHALVPGLFQTTGSRSVAFLHDRMIVSRNKAFEVPNVNHSDSSRDRADQALSQRLTAVP